MGLLAIYLRILRSACARAEPVVSACVLEKSLKMYRGYRRHMPTRGCFLVSEDVEGRVGMQNFYNIADFHGFADLI